MTFDEIKRIPDLQIHPDGLIEDCFYYKMAEAGRLSEEQGRKAHERLKARRGDPRMLGSMIIAKQMIANIDRYGIACADWI